MKSTTLFFFTTLLSSCVTAPQQGNTPEEIAANRIAYFKNQNFNGIAAMESEAFVRDYPASQYRQEIQTNIGDYEFSLERWDTAIISYEKLLAEFPSHPRKQYVLNQIASAKREINTFSPFYKMSVSGYTPLTSTQRIYRQEGTHNVVLHADLAYIFSNRHGVYVGMSPFSYKAKTSVYPTVDAKEGAEINAGVLAFGYLHRISFTEQWWSSYHIGPNLQFIDARGGAEHYKAHRKIGAEQSISIDHCHYSLKPKFCTGFTSFLELSHVYIPNIHLGLHHLEGQIVSMGLGVRY